MVSDSSSGSNRAGASDNAPTPTSGERVDFRYAPPSAWTAICRPDDPHKSLVREDGALLYGFAQTHLASWEFHRTVEFRPQTSHRASSVSQRTEDARTPIVVTTVTYPTCRLELRAAGHLDRVGHRYDIVLWSLRVDDDAPGTLTGLHVDIHERGDVRHAGADVQPGRRVYALAPHQMGDYPPFPDDTGDTGDTDDTDDTGDAPDAELVLLSQPQRLRVTHASGFRPASGLETLPVVAGAGETLHGALVLPLDGAPTEHVDLAWAQSALDEERGYWRDLDALDVPIRVPDTHLQDMVVASARNILQARDLDSAGRPVFQVGATVYRGLWIVDGHFLLEAAQYLHLGEDARHGIQALLARVRADGSINALSDQPGLAAHPHSKETGIGITTLVRQWELTGDDTWLRELWPIVRGAVDHIAELRRQARRLSERSPAHRLMPPAFSDGGVAKRRPELTTALWTLVGLGYAARAAGVLDLEDRDTIRQMHRELLADLRRTVDRYAETLPDGHRFAPMTLPGSGRHQTVVGVDDPPERSRIRPQSATWALAQTIWPGEVLAPDDPIVEEFLHLLDTIDDEEHVPAASGWLPYRAVWAYYASFAAHVWLYAGRPDKAVELLYGFCNHAAPTRVWREEQPLSDTGHDQVWGDMPHNWASAELIRLVRDLLVFERQDGLDLLPGAPAAWVDHPDGVDLERTPTRFGHVTLRAHRPDRDRPGTVVVRVEPHRESRAPAPECRLHLPETDTGWRVEVNGVDLGTLRGTARLPLDRAPRP